MLLAAALLLAAAPYDASPVAAAQNTAAQNEQDLEHQVKAAFLFRFIDFVTWPDSAFASGDAPFTIAVAGAEAPLEELRQITAGRAIAGRSVEVHEAPAPAAMPAAQLVFIPNTEQERLREWIRAAPRHALIVTESAGALAIGSVINFVLVERRVRFEISLGNAEQRGLRMSSRLLALAAAVRTGP